MTDRPMAGSVQHGRTELLINRRSQSKDKGGIDEKLNETGPNKKGYVLEASFFINLSSDIESAKKYADDKEIEIRRPLQTHYIQKAPHGIRPGKYFQDYE